MEIQHTKQVTAFLESMKRMNKFSTLQSEDNSFSIPLKISGYNELNIMVSDLLKASIVLMNKEARSLANFESDINVVTLLEIALQLLPDQEMEVLDDLHKICLDFDTK